MFQHLKTIQEETSQKLEKEWSSVIPRFFMNGVKSFLADQQRIAFEAGRKSVLNEFKHEQEKLLDGFNHPKDCKICAELLTTQEK